MKFFVGLLLVTLQVIIIVSTETVQLESSQGILIPAPLAHSVRVARGSYGGPAPSAPAPSSYSAPGPAPASYSAPAVSSYSAPAPPPYSSPAAPSQQPTSIPAPPCPRNYLFSCQPSLSPVPCAAAAQAPVPSGGSYSSPQGAYSQFIPQYAVPVVRELY